MNVIDAMKERHSVRKYDPTFKIERKEIEELLVEATTAPSSSNLQPWRFMVIDSEEVKKELRAIAFNQEHVETSSAVIAVLGDLEMYHNAERVYMSNMEAGYMTKESAERMISNSVSMYSGASVEARSNIAHFDAGLVSMQLMLAAKARGYDTVTMGGFNKEQFAKHFELDARYTPIVLIALGKAAAPAFNTTRIPVKDLVDFK